jgi:hypothetical protein
MRRSSASTNRSRAIILRCAFITILLIPSSAAVSQSWAEQPPATTLVNPPWSHCYGLHRVSQTHLDFYSGYRKKFRSPQGLTALKMEYNDAPGRKDDDELTVHGVNSGSGEIIYNTSLLGISFFNPHEGQGGALRNPTGIGSNPQGLVVVSDTGNKRVLFLRNVENELRYDFSVTLENSGLPLHSPCGVAIEDDSVYIADAGNNRIVVLNRAGVPAHEIRSRLPLLEPFGIAIIWNQVWNHYHSRFIVVTDSLQQRISRIALDGTVEAVVRFDEISDRIGGFFYPAIDYYSNVYVSDTLSGCIYKFDKSLRFLTRTGCDPDWEIQLDEPRGLAIYRRFGQLFVAERQGASYFWIGTDVRHLSCRAEQRGDTMLFYTRFLLTEHSIIEIALETESGERVKSFVENRFMEPGRRTGVYSIRMDELPFDYAKCTYTLAVTAKPTYSSRKYLTVEKRTVVRIQ